MSVDTWLQSFLLSSSTVPSPTSSCRSSSSSSTSPHDDIIDVGTFADCDYKKESTIIKPEPMKPVDYSLQLAQLQMLWQPMQQFLALCQIQNGLPLINSPTESLASVPTLDMNRAQFSTNLNSPFTSVPSITPSSRKRSATDSPTMMDRPIVAKKPTKLRKLEEDTVTCSPVSGMFIKEESCLPPPEELQKEADSLDETAAYVEVSIESKRKIAEIENVIGDSICCLCKVKYEDVFKLAQHRCPRISHEEYKCPECDKTFSCPANLASHRRWHRPRDVPESIRCHSCLQSFSTKKQHKAHLSSCLGSTTSPTSLSTLSSLFTPSVMQNLSNLNLELH
ncbi:unnamed protein product [Auanema sp. JU1783]|nr:unnamed protein product [Auanema sp. JU1783]